MLNGMLIHVYLEQNIAASRSSMLMSYEETLLESTGLTLISTDNINDATEGNPNIDPRSIDNHLSPSLQVYCRFLLTDLLKKPLHPSHDCTP